jgi:hypothetical protein
MHSQASSKSLRLVLLLSLVLACVQICLPDVVAQPVNLSELAQLTPGRTRAENALWIENPLTARFNTSKEVVVADLKGPGVVTMIHFAMPEVLKLNRDVLLRTGGMAKAPRALMLRSWTFSVTRLDCARR